LKDNRVLQLDKQNTNRTVEPWGGKAIVLGKNNRLVRQRGEKIKKDGQEGTRLREKNMPKNSLEGPYKSRVRKKRNGKPKLDHEHSKTRGKRRITNGAKQEGRGYLLRGTSSKSLTKLPETGNQHLFTTHRGHGPLYVLPRRLFPSREDETEEEGGGV